MKISIINSKPHIAPKRFQWIRIFDIHVLLAYFKDESIGIPFESMCDFLGLDFENQITQLTRNSYICRHLYKVEFPRDLDGLQLPKEDLYIDVAILPMYLATIEDGDIKSVFARETLDIIRGFLHGSLAEEFGVGKKSNILQTNRYLAEEVYDTIGIINIGT